MASPALAVACVGCCLRSGRLTKLLASARARQNSPSNTPPTTRPRQNSPRRPLQPFPREKTRPTTAPSWPNRENTRPATAPSWPNREIVRPASALSRSNREIVRPASPKTPKSSHFCRAGRTFSRFPNHFTLQGELFRADSARNEQTRAPYIARRTHDTIYTYLPHPTATKFAQQQPFPGQTATKLAQQQPCLGQTATKLAQQQPRLGQIANKFAQQQPTHGQTAKKLAQQARKHRNLAIFAEQGELFRVSQTTSPCRANIFAQIQHSTCNSGALAALMQGAHTLTTVRRTQAASPTRSYPQAHAEGLNRTHHRHTVGLMHQQRGLLARNEGVAMLRDRVESIRSSLVIADSHATKDRIHRRVRKGELIRLLAGICIPSARLNGLNSRERKTAVFIARMCALSLRYPDYVISGGVAAYLLGPPRRRPDRKAHTVCTITRLPPPDSFSSNHS